MSASNEGLMKLIALTKQQREIGPLLQEYVQRKYGVENMAAFTKGDIDGVDDKEALYQQWIEWIEAGKLGLFKEDNAAASPAMAPAQAEAAPDAVADDAAPPDSGQAQQGESTDLNAVGQSSDYEPPYSDAAIDDGGAETEAKSGAGADVDSVPTPDTPTVKGQSPMQGTQTGSVDALILSMIQTSLDNQPQPEESITEDRIREIVREELRSMLKSFIG